jgi:hypothetical protein
MQTESQQTRYRNGYVAGQRDGDIEDAQEADTRMRTATGDAWADAGYTDGFFASRNAKGDRFLNRSLDVLSNVFWIPQLTGWVKRHTSRSA